MKLIIIFVLALAVLSFAYYDELNSSKSLVEISRKNPSLTLLRPKKQIAIQKSEHHHVETKEDHVHEEPSEIISQSQDSVNVSYDHNKDEIYEEFCIDWKPGLSCILDEEINVSTVLFNPDTGHGRIRQADVILDSVNFSSIIQKLSTKKSRVESYTIEQNLNDQIYTMVSNTSGVDGGKFSCSDDICGTVFIVDNWDVWSDFIETSRFNQDIRLGNKFIAKVDSPNTPRFEMRVIITPGSEPILQH